MSRVIQLISHSQHLFALTDAGEIFATPSVLNAKWSLFEGPIPLQPFCQGSASDKQCEPRLNRENVIPEIERMHKLIPDPQSGCPSMETTWMNPNVRRRPTSIGSDGNYIPKRNDVVHAVKAVGWCVKQPALLLRGGDDYVGYLGFTYSDGSSGFVSSHYSSTESFSKSDIESKVELKNSGLALQWLGVVDPTDERLKPFTNPEF